MKTSPNDPAAPPTTPRRTVFDWSDLVTVRIPADGAKDYLHSARETPMIAVNAEAIEEFRASADATGEEILTQIERQVGTLPHQREFPKGWLIEALRERFDDPATVALLEVIAENAGDTPDDLTAALVEVYEEWQEARPERMVPPETAKPDRAEAARLRDAGHEYWAEGEKGKAADCFEQALTRLLGPRPGALGVVLMDDTTVGDPVEGKGS